LFISDKIFILIFLFFAFLRIFWIVNRRSAFLSMQVDLLGEIMSPGAYDRYYVIDQPVFAHFASHCHDQVV